VNAFKQLPWRSLFLAAILAVIIVKAFDYVVAQSLSILSPDATILKLLVTPAGGLLLFGCGGLAIGGFGVLCLERFGNVRLIHSNTLWALILCLLVSLWFLSQLPVGGLGFVAFSEAHLVGVIIGVFWRGQDYWR
jgi:hypothetical protein